MADTTTIQVEIKQKTDDGLVKIHPLTDASVVQTTNNTTVQQELDNAVPLIAGDHISIAPTDNGLAVSFTGSLAPNVTVKGTAPIAVAADTSDTSATYTVSHNTSGVTAGTYGATSGATATAGAGTKTITVPQIKVDNKGHITSAANQTLSITIPSTSDNVTTSDTLVSGQIIVGGGNKTIKTTDKSFTTTAPSASSSDSTIPTSKAVNAAIDAKITANAQYLGTFGTLADLTASGTIGSKAKVIGSWARAALTNGTFEMWDVSTSAKTVVHNGDIVILTSTTVTATTTGSSWDVIHTEIDNNTWRTIQVNGTSIGNNTLNLKAGTNVSISTSTTSGVETATISATDTNTTYTLSHSKTSAGTEQLDTVVLTPSTGNAQTITINNVAHAAGASTATSASKVANALSFKSGDTTKQTYDGSKAVSVTYSDVGAAAASHSHSIILSGDVTSSATSISGTVTTTIGNGKVTTAKIADGAVTDAKLSTSGVTAGTYSAVTVNNKGRVTAGAQLIKMYAKNTADATITADTGLVTGGFAFVALS